MDKRMNLLLLKLGFLLTDLALINLGYVLAFVLKFGWDIPHYNFVAYISTWPWLSLSALCFFLFLQALWKLLLAVDRGICFAGLCGILSSPCCHGPVLLLSRFFLPPYGLIDSAVHSVGSAGFVAQGGLVY